MSYGGASFNPYQQPDGYSAPPGAFPPQNAQVSPQAHQWFAMVDRDRFGKISASELKAALVNGKEKSFSDNECNLMISVFDNDAHHVCTIDVYKFEKLYNYINQWLSAFETYRSRWLRGYEEHELTQGQMGFCFTDEFIKFIMKNSDARNHNEMSDDQFIVLCVQIQRFTEAFRLCDTHENGTITIGFEDFLNIAIGCSY